MHEPACQADGVWPVQNPTSVFGTRFGKVTYTGGGSINTASTTSPPPPPASHGVSQGALAGIVIGSVVGFFLVAAILAAAFLYFKHNR